MAVVYKSGGKLEGLASDTKPTTVPANSVFTETDTPARFVFGGINWVALGGGGTLTKVAEHVSHGDNGGYSRTNSSYYGHDQYAGFSDSNMTSGGVNVTITNDGTMVICQASAQFACNVGNSRTFYIEITRDGTQKAVSPGVSTATYCKGQSVVWAEVLNAGTYNFSARTSVSYAQDTRFLGGGWSITVVESQ